MGFAGTATWGDHNCSGIHSQRWKQADIRQFGEDKRWKKGLFGDEWNGSSSKGRVRTGSSLAKWAAAPRSTSGRDWILGESQPDFALTGWRQSGNGRVWPSQEYR